MTWKPDPECRSQGFALATLIIFMTALTIMLAAAAPVYRVQVERELEEELIFRGEEYARAIQKYQREFGIYPPNLDALLETNGIRYLRRAYTDPITGEDFRILTINQDGTINGSTLFAQQSAVQALFRGSNPVLAGQGATSPFSPGGRFSQGPNANSPGSGGSSGFGQPQSAVVNPFAAGNAGFGQSPDPNNQRPGFPSVFGSPQPGGTDQTSRVNQGFGQAAAPFTSGFEQNQGVSAGVSGPGGRGGTLAGPPQPNTVGGQAARSSSGNGSPTGSLGQGGIVGVAPANEQASLKAYNRREVYSEWEFLGIPGFGALPAQQVPGQIPPFQQNPAGPSSSRAPNPFN